MAKCLCPIVPTIFLAPLAAWKIENLTMMSPDEVSALGVVRDVYEDDQLTEIVVEDIRVPSQQAGPASTEMDPEGVAAVLAEFAAHGVDAADVRLWMHSHAAMKTFWSQTDVDCIEGLRTGNGAPLVSIVTNHEGHRLGRIDWWEPVRFTLDDVPVEVLLPDYDLADELSATLAARVRPFPPPPKTKAFAIRDTPAPNHHGLWWEDDGLDLLGGHVWGAELDEEEGR